MADSVDVTAQMAVYERAGPMLLAQESAYAQRPPFKIDPDWQKLRDHLETNLASLRNWRNSYWDGPWADIARYIEPIRSTFLTQQGGGYPTPNSQNRGRELNRSILDPTATQAVRVCSAGLMSGLASPSRPWFKLIPVITGAEMDSAGSDWLDEVQSRMMTVMAVSNFYNSFALETLDLVTYGSAPVLCYEDERDVVRFYNPVCGEYFMGSDATLRVNPLARNFVLNVFQLVDMFGLENLPEEVQTLWQQKGAVLNQEFSVAQMIEPNYAIADRGGTGSFGRIKGGFTWREVYWMYGRNSAIPLSIRGFHEQPFTACRWMTQGNDAYGHSPVMDVLPDVKTLQKLTLRQAQAIEKMINPPLLADISMKNEAAVTIPGGITFVNGLNASNGMRSVYQINPDINHMTLNIQDVRGRIKSGLFLDLFMMLDNLQGKQMTAFEVGQRMQEKLQVLGPVIEGLLNESLKPKVKRIYSVMKRRGMFPEKPPSVQNMPLDVEFVSMLAMAQKAAATGGLERLTKMAGEMLGAFPTISDILDMDELLREYNALLANPAKILRGPEQVAQIRAQKQQQAASQQRLQMIAQGGPAAVQAAQTMSQTPIGGSSLLDHVLGVGGAPAGGAGGAPAAGDGG